MPTELDNDTNNPFILYFHHILFSHSFTNFNCFPPIKVYEPVRKNIIVGYCLFLGSKYIHAKTSMM